jgi:hypothetical protein
VDHDTDGSSDCIAFCRRVDVAFRGIRSRLVSDREDGIDGRVSDRRKGHPNRSPGRGGRLRPFGNETIGCRSSPIGAKASNSEVMSWKCSQYQHYDSEWQKAEMSCRRSVIPETKKGPEISLRIADARS